MPDPDRLLNAQGTSAFEKELLASWHEQGPSADTRRNVLALASVGAAGVAAGYAAVTPTLAPKAATVGAAAIAKGVALALVSMAVVAAGLAATRSVRIPHPLRDASLTTSPRLAPAPALVREADSDAAAHAGPRASALAKGEPVAPSPRAVPHHADAHVQPAVPSSRLALEVTSLDRARQALVGGRAADALSLLDEYRHDFPVGVLAQEADVLRVEALQDNGEHAAAARLGDRFLVLNPDSPHATRIRDVLGAKQ